MGEILNAKIKHFENYILIICLVIIGLYISPYLILGESVHIRIHDNLDANFVWYKVLLENDVVFAPGNILINQFMGGIPRNCFPSEFNFTLLWFWLFGPFAAYVFERVLIALVGFCGMYLLLKKHIIPEKNCSIIQAGVALIFGLLPFWPFGGLSVSGLPFLAHAILNLRAGEKKIYNWIVIAIYPFYSHLTLAGVFVIALILLLLSYDGVIKKRINWNIIWSVALTSFLYVISHYRLFQSFLIDGSYISHRKEFCIGAIAQTSLPSSFKESIRLLIKGHTHAQSLQGLVTIPVILLGCLLLWEHRGFKKKYAGLLIFLLATSLFYGLCQWAGFSKIQGLIFFIIPMQIDRFYWLHPFFWYVLFALSLFVMQQKLRIGKYLVILAIFFQLLYVCAHHEHFTYRNDPSFREFFAEEQFESIKKYINRPLDTYRVISLGLHPSICQYNGFYTLDGYLADYPLAYKHAFKEVIAGELIKNENLSSYFDNWGSRAYIFLAQDIGYQNIKNNNNVINDLDLNVDKLKDKGCEYIFSAVRIDTKKNPEYHLENTFRCNKSAWDIYLYKIL
ncbi:MAG: hypothetical protein C4518_15620 [Desulfobacteraceae bacterium]|nr:MAG: hypothetical protein C4518_15620 [Desulfobacteraceae bacterium]